MEYSRKGKILAAVSIAMVLLGVMIAGAESGVEVPFITQALVNLFGLLLFIAGALLFWWNEKQLEKKQKEEDERKYNGRE